MAGKTKTKTAALKPKTVAPKPQAPPKRGRRKKEAGEGKKIQVALTISPFFYSSLRRIEAEDEGREESRYRTDDGAWSFSCEGLTPLIGAAINEYLKLRGLPHDPLYGVRLPPELEEALAYVKRNKNNLYARKVGAARLSPTRNRLLEWAFIDWIKDQGFTLEEEGTDFKGGGGEEWSPALKEAITAIAEQKLIKGATTVDKLLTESWRWWLTKEIKAGRLSSGLLPKKGK